MDNQEDRVKTIISRVIKVNTQTLNLDDDLIEKHGMDSMQRVEIVIELEKAFNISIPDNIALTLRTVKKILKFLEKELVTK